MQVDIAISRPGEPAATASGRSIGEALEILLGEMTEAELHAWVTFGQGQAIRRAWGRNVRQAPATACVNGTVSPERVAGKLTEGSGV